MIYEKELADDWLEEREARGEPMKMREMLTKPLTRQYSSLPAGLLEKVETSDRMGCERLFDRITIDKSFDSLQWKD